MSYLSIIIFTFIFFNLSYAQPLIERDSRYIYQKFPLNQMTSEMKREVFSTSFKFLNDELKVLQEKEMLPKGIELNQLDNVEKTYGKIDELIDRITNLDVNHIEDEGFISLTDVVPTAFVVTIGGKYSANFKIGVAGSIQLGFVIIPYFVKKTKIVPGTNTAQEEWYIDFDGFFIIWPNTDFGVGMGAGGRLRYGLGLIWGHMDSPMDFNGPFVGLSKTLAIGGGLNLKGGYLFNRKRTSRWNNDPDRDQKKSKTKMFPYFGVTAEVGPTATAELHINISYIIDGVGFLNRLNPFESDDDFSANQSWQEDSWDDNNDFSEDVENDDNWDIDEPNEGVNPDNDSVSAEKAQKMQRFNRRFKTSNPFTRRR